MPKLIDRHGKLTLEVDSDAPTKSQAVKAVDAWARENGYVLAPGVPPRRVYRSGRFVYQILCLRLINDAELAVRRQRVREVRAILDSMPNTKHREEDA